MVLVSRSRLNTRLARPPDELVDELPPEEELLKPDDELLLKPDDELLPEPDDELLLEELLGSSGSGIFGAKAGGDGVYGCHR